MSSESESDLDHLKYRITVASQNDLRAQEKRDHVLEALLRGGPSDLPTSVTMPSDDCHSKETSFRPARRVFREWPRDRSGVVFDGSVCEGKNASNGTELWGATLYDF